MTMTMIMRKKKKAMRPKIKMMRTTLPWVTSRRNRHTVMPTGRLRDLLNHLNITNPREFRIKRVLRPGREEFKAIMEIFREPTVLNRKKGLAFRATYQDAVADATW
jgi:riboflavin synthase